MSNQQEELDVMIQYLAFEMRRAVEEYLGTVVVLGAPQPQPRHRVPRKGKAYIPSGHPVRPWRQAIRKAFRESSFHDRMIGAPVALSVSFVLERPESHLRKDGTPRKSAPVLPTGAQSGDYDNLLKPVKDVMEKCNVFGNDSQVCYMLPGGKRYAELDEKPHASVDVYRAKPWWGLGGEGE